MDVYAQYYFINHNTKDNGDCDQFDMLSPSKLSGLLGVLVMHESC